MASSQVEIASSSSPFGHVLRDRNRRDRCSGSHRDSNAAAFQKNLKDLVHTHIHSCLSSQPPPPPPPPTSSSSDVDYADLWVHKPQWDNNENNSPTTTTTITKDKPPTNKWDRAREMMLSRNKSDPVEVPNQGGVSTLVRRWRDFETVSKSSVNSTTASCSTRSNDDISAAAASVEAPAAPQSQRSYEDTCDESSADGRFGTPAMSMNGDASGDWEADKTDPPSAAQDRQSDSKEREKLRVADIIRKLASSKGEENHESEHGCSNALACGESLPRIKTTSEHSEQQQRSFFPVLHSPRIIRGRQALSDLLLQMERNRHRELEALRQRTAVSKFQQRGRIQALLKVRFLRRGRDARDDRSTNGTLSESNRKSQSSIMHIRERFNTGSQNGVADSRSLSREAADNSQESRNCTQNQQGVQNYDRENKVKVGSELASYNKQREDNRQPERAGMQPGVGFSRSTSRAVEDGFESGFVSTSTQEASEPITVRTKVVDSSSRVGKVFTSNQLQEKNHHGDVNEKISPRKVTTKVKVTSSSNPQKEMSFHTRHSDSSCSPNRNKVDRSHQSVSPSLRHCTSQLQSSDISRDQASWGNTSSEASQEKSLAIVDEKISPRKVTTKVKVTSSSNPQKEMSFHTRHSDSSCSPNHNKVDRSHQSASPSLRYCTSQLQSSDISHDQGSWENTSSEASHEKSLDIIDTPRFRKDSEQSIHREEQGTNNQQRAGTSNEWPGESTKPQSDLEEEATKQNLVDSDCGWVSDYSHTPSGWDELQSNYEQQSESNQDWVSDIARPRKEWEGLRQARYQEMLDPFIDNHDIRQLLHRKSVSIFLNSGLREKIDRLMVCRSQQLPNAMSGQVGARMTEDDNKEKGMVSHNEAQRGEGEDDEEEEDSGYEDDFEDDNIPVPQQYLEPVELVDQNKASQTLGSWSNNQDTFHSWINNQDKGVSNDSYHFPCNHNQQCSSSTRHPSAEMELIYELRGHMEQLHQEIFEIRRSIKSCMNMQMKLQHSIKQEVAAAIIQSGPMMGTNSDKCAKRANCCVCYEGQVDSLLYRCGHMCTCFRCAHELLWGTGKCPICESPIIDVVRAYINYA